MGFDAKDNKVNIQCIFSMIYFLALPLTIAVNESGSSYLKLITIPIAGFLLISLLFNKRNFELNAVQLFFVLYVLSVISTLYIDNKQTAMEQVRGYIQSAALMFCITLHKYNEREIRWLEYTQIMLLAIMVYLSLFGGASYAGRTTIEIFGNVSDPNFFCGFFIFPVAVALKYVYESKYRLIFLVLIVISVYCVLLSGSRGGLLGVTAAIVTFVILKSKSTEHLLLTLILFSVIGIVFWKIAFPLLPENIAERMSVQSVVETRGTYRGDIWMSMLNEIRNSTWQLFFGRGIDARHKMLVMGRMQEVFAHNNFIQTLYNQGLIGFILFLGLSLSVVLRNWKKRIHITAGMIGMMVLTMSLSVNPNIKVYWNLIMYAGLNFIDISEKEVKNKNEYIHKTFNEFFQKKIAGLTGKKE